jgi:single-strand selective monofunctional uracil DNA glycosylase
MLGMNPGPFGMAQTGVPFGEVSVVKEYLQIDEPLGTLPEMHPKRIITGLDCQRSEVSGRRLWALVKEHYPISSQLYGELAIMNYCPVVFVDKGATGKNITPDKIEIHSRKELERICDSYLDDMISLIAPKNVVGIGKYAQKKLQQSIERLGIDIPAFTILHPSPANPQANKNWNEKVTKSMQEFHSWEK